MKESILNVLMYLFNRTENQVLPVQSQQALIKELEIAGFKSDDAEQAFEWLDGLADPRLENTEHTADTSNYSAIRVLAAEERAHIDADCWGYFLFLENTGILDNHIREIVINCLLRFEPETIDIPLVKWIALIILSTKPNYRDALLALEKLVLEDGPLGNVQ
jgi:Smg protein